MPDPNACLFVGEVGMFYFYANTGHQVIALPATLSGIFGFVPARSVGNNTKRGISCIGNGVITTAVIKLLIARRYHQNCTDNG